MFGQSRGWAAVVLLAVGPAALAQTVGLGLWPQRPALPYQFSGGGGSWRQGPRPSNPPVILQSIGVVWEMNTSCCVVGFGGLCPRTPVCVGGGGGWDSQLQLCCPVALVHVPSPSPPFVTLPHMNESCGPVTLLICKGPKVAMAPARGALVDAAQNFGAQNFGPHQLLEQ